MDTDVQAFLAEIEAFVLAEREASRQEVRRIWSLPLDERVKKGYAIKGLRVCEINPARNGHHEITLAADEDNSRFREGDAVKLTEGNPDDPLQLLAEGRVVSSDAGVLVIEVKRHSLVPGQDKLVLDVSFIDLTERYLKALHAVGATPRGREKIVPLLLGQIEPKIQRGLVNLAALAAEGLNPEQIEAVEAAAGTDLCYLVQGPPGTGKTTVLARLVQELVRQKPNARILVTSFTHRAIENALLAILKRGFPRENLFKVGERLLDDRIPHVSGSDDLRSFDSDAPLVLGATPFALSSRLSHFEFDWVIVDEASQMTLPLSVMAMLGGGKWIFFGDDQQLPPVVQSLSPKDAVNQSVFGRLRDSGYHVMLRTTHRLPPPLAAWPSRKFYRGSLLSGGDAIERRLRLASLPNHLREILAPEPCAVFVNCEHQHDRAASAEEASIAAAIVHGLASTGYDLSKVGIVVPYRRQARLIREHLHRRGVDGAAARALVADTVERMQGQERDLIIVSFTTSSLEFAGCVSDFLFMRERLNVAVTRARAKLVILASSVWRSEYPKHFEDAKPFSEFLAQCHCVQFPRENYG